MSGIVGVYYLDDRPVDPLDLGRMVEILAHRGPDGAEIWREGSVGLGHRMLWTTPESLNEKLPLVNQTGDLVITADARIDNRDELITALGFTDRSPQDLADSQLILAAYEKWGERCPEKLLGDFAFAIWDGHKKELFCARDHFGVKPFYYYSCDRAFIFASEIKAILCLSEVPRRLNEVRVADYLASLFDDKAITFYQDIFRLPPAHSMLVSREGIQLQLYWSLNPTHELRFGSDEAYAEAFRELFFKAVRCRLRSAFSVGSLLSGGLDSSSITCVAHQLLVQDGGGRLSTFSAVFEQATECDERPFIEAVLAQDGFEPHYLPGDVTDSLSRITSVFGYQDEAFYAPNLVMSWQLYNSVKTLGIRVLLDGFDGDGTVSHGFGLLKELAQTRRWLTLAINLKYLSEAYRVSPWETVWTFWRYIWNFSLEPVIIKHRLLKSVGWGCGVVYQYIRNRHDEPNNGHSEWSAILNPDFIQRTNLNDRYRAWRQAQPNSAQTEQETHYRIITQGIQPFALEVLDKVAAPFSIEKRYPFWDKRLVEFCLALPPEQKLHRGWGRMVLRRAMTGILPGKVQWRRGKTDFTPNVLRGLLTSDRAYLEKLINRSEIMKEYVNTTALREVYNRFISQDKQKKPQDLFIIWRVVSLALWLQQNDI